MWIDQYPEDLDTPSKCRYTLLAGSALVGNAVRSEVVGKRRYEVTTEVSSAGCEYTFEAMCKACESVRQYPLIRITLWERSAQSPLKHVDLFL